MKTLEPGEASEVSGGAAASPYPVPGSTPPYVPSVPQPTTDLISQVAGRDRIA